MIRMIYRGRCLRRLAYLNNHSIAIANVECCMELSCCPREVKSCIRASLQFRMTKPNLPKPWSSEPLRKQPEKCIATPFNHQLPVQHIQDHPRSLFSPLLVKYIHHVVVSIPRRAQAVGQVHIPHRPSMRIHNRQSRRGCIKGI